jgi:hypothetical protein
MKENELQNRIKHSLNLKKQKQKLQNYEELYLACFLFLSLTNFMPPLFKNKTLIS